MWSCRYSLNLNIIDISKINIYYNFVYEEFDLDYKLRPQNLSPETYFDLAKEFEKLRS